MNQSRSRILIPFCRSVILSRIACLLFVTTFNSCLSISIAFHRTSTIVCTSVDCCISASTTFSSPTSICIIYASTKYYSIASSSSDSSMNTRSTNVVPGPVCYLTHQLLLLLHKNSIVDVPLLYILWIIVYTNCIFSLYVFIFAHSEDDDECDNDFTTNCWIFNTPSISTLLNNYSSIFVIFNNLLPPPAFVYAHYFTFYFHLLLFVVSQSHPLHSCYYEL